MASALVTTLSATKDRLKTNLWRLAAAVAILFLLEAVDALLPARFTLDQFGVQPGHWERIWHIPLAPFLHGSFGHVAGNAWPLLALGFLISLSSWRRVCQVAAFAAVVSGLGIMVFGEAGSNHLGASSVVAGFFGYALSRGIVERNALRIAVGLAVGAAWFFTVVGLLVPQQGVSWAGHFFGLCGGLLAAFALPGKR